MSVQNFSFLARLEVAEKFVVVGWWSRPSLGFSFSQAEQNDDENYMKVNHKNLSASIKAKNTIVVEEMMHDYDETSGEGIIEESDKVHENHEDLHGDLDNYQQVSFRENDDQGRVQKTLKSSYKPDPEILNLPTLSGTLRQNEGTKLSYFAKLKNE